MAGEPSAINYLEGASHMKQVEVLGEGSFGVVVLAADMRRNDLVAVKLIPRGPQLADFARYVKREIIHQSTLRHPFIVGLKEVFLTPKYLGIAMEYVAGGNLYQKVRKQRYIPEPQARWLFQQLIIALDYAHRRGVSNRDLKLENILVDRDTADHPRPLVKLCDFGYSKHDTNSTADSVVGTNVYMAPEILRARPYNAQKVDMWACGVILYTMVFGKYPFPDDDPLEQRRRMINKEIDVPSTPIVSNGGRELILNILEPDPDRRITMEEVLANPWFLQELPPGALDMNESFLKPLPASDPSVDEQYVSAIERIVDRAGRVGSQDDRLGSMRLS
eukprot:jgi/Botrbrau1/6572/Bobra.40_2s0035.1